MTREAERKRLVELLWHDCDSVDGECHCESCRYKGKAWLIRLKKRKAALRQNGN